MARGASYTREFDCYRRHVDDRQAAAALKKTTDSNTAATE
jgi:hypothetical protein